MKPLIEFVCYVAIIGVFVVFFIKSVFYSDKCNDLVVRANNIMDNHTDEDSLEMAFSLLLDAEEAAFTFKHFEKIRKAQARIIKLTVR